ncbi:ganglioside GM2 activator-like [Physella acuta]|uniref:ganglioside GM2 activator-like n=1 Tax=Physella acuta TaxID=109671 RepID=UPI0027DAD92F|nr:ganglioside GM2 activator-like [Physella acuta]
MKMKFTSFAILILFIAYSHCLKLNFKNVENFVIEKEQSVVRQVSKLENQATSLLSSNLIRHHFPQRLGSRPTGLSSSTKRRILTDDFKWKSCGPADQSIELRNLTINPSPLYFPGKLSFGFDVVFHSAINPSDKITGSLKLLFQASSGSWISIPCIGQIGSCTYTDICSMTQAISCPDELKKKGIPCTCPFNGEYKLDNFDVEIDAAIFLSGNYQGQVILSDSNRGQMACYVVFFTIG